MEWYGGDKGALLLTTLYLILTQDVYLGRMGGGREREREREREGGRETEKGRGEKAVFTV